MTPTLLFIILVLLGLILLAAEIAVPAHGVLAVAGIVCLIVAVVICFHINQWLGVTVLLLAALATPVLGALAVRAWPKTPLGRRLTLGPVAAPKPPQTAPIGAVGTAISDLKPMGLVEFGDLRLEAISEHGMLEAGTKVKVVSLENGRLTVRAEGK